MESGFEFHTTATGGIAPAIQVPSTATDGVQFPMIQITTKVRMHNHPNGIDPVFSEKDILGMAELFSVKDDLGAPDAEEVTPLLVKPGGLYALRVDDPNKVIAFNDKMKTGLDENNESEIDNYIRDYKIYLYTAQLICNGCPQDEYFELIDEYVVTLFNEWNTGLVLYKATENPDGTYTWEKVEDN